MSVTYNGTTYYYLTNIQGDVIAILNSSGEAVVEYYYDAWGLLNSTIGSMASTLGVHNPLRYRGYVYDQESGLYYLQSRYYNPEVGRFLNADAFASTGQGLLGSNMFSYCLNNPSNMFDVGGYIAIPIGVLVEVAEIVLCVIFVIVIVSSPQFQQNASDTLSGILEQITATQSGRTNSTPNVYENSIINGLGQIAGSAKEYTCDSTAKAMANYLKKNKQQGYIITIKYSGVRDFIWSDIKNKTISYTGVHVGVEYSGIVYCVVHPYGLPEAQWINDFKGTGTRTITKIPI